MSICQSKVVGALFTALTLLAPGLSSAADTVPKQQTTQVPGYYHMNLGQTQVTALYDGFIKLDPKILHGVSADDMQSLLARVFAETDEGIQTAVNGYLLNTGSNIVLVDVGAGSCFGPTLGKIIENLRAAGYQPDQVDTVLLTHLHGDHGCGLVTASGQPAFPNATVYAAHEEAAFWLDKDIAAKAPQEAQPFFKMAQDAVAPYRANARFKTFKAGDTLVPGVIAVAEYGHTPGHTGFLISSDTHELLIWGDVVHSHAVQFAHPEVSIDFDVNPEQAIATRQRVFENAAKQRLWVAGAHLPFPGLGHVRTEQAGYAWVPLEYSPLATK